MKGTAMSAIVRLKSISAVLTVLATTAILAAHPATAKERYQPVAAPFALQQIDRNGDGDISRKEWKWAEKHGFDRLSRYDNRRVSRREYQAYLNRYLAYRNWYQARYQPYQQPSGPAWVDRNGNTRYPEWNRSDREWPERNWQDADAHDDGHRDPSQDGSQSPWLLRRR